MHEWAGYSGTPLAKKLGFREGTRVRISSAPENYLDLVSPRPENVYISATLRKVALPLGLVDVKVCAVDDTWSGLELVIRKELRQ